MLIEPATWAELQKVADYRGVSRADLLRMAMRDLIKQFRKDRIQAEMPTGGRR
jgi:hypothetical protein